jgi:Fe-S-cluster containining protein
MEQLMEIILADIDDILSDLERLPQPKFAKIGREDLKEAMIRFLEAPGMMLPITARQILIRCKRCGECCRYCNPISLDDEECNAVARHLGMSDYSFKERYIDVLSNIDALTNPKKDESKEGDLAIKKNREMHCPFYDEVIGCSIYEVRPTACRIFPYLQKDVIDESAHNSRMICFCNCPASIELDNKIKTLSRRLRSNPGVYIYAKSKVNDLDGMLIYILNVFMRGMDNNDGPDVACSWLGNLGMDRLATNEELDRLSLLVCGVFMDFPIQE